MNKMLISNFKLFLGPEILKAPLIKTMLIQPISELKLKYYLLPDTFFKQWYTVSTFL